MGLSVGFQAHDVPSAELAESVSAILDETRVLGLATTAAGGTPDACNAHFAYDGECRLYILTPPSTSHIQNIQRDGRVAVVVADTQQTADGGMHGLQIVGRAAQATGDELEQGLAAYRERFPGTATVLASGEALEASGWDSRMYVIWPEKVTVFDERRFGPERWVEASVG
jgi:uncharacterized protein YhbP (UPF0306 family)